MPEISRPAPFQARSCIFAFVRRLHGATEEDVVVGRPVDATKKIVAESTIAATTIATARRV
jgi:hypothetical protein